MNISPSLVSFIAISKRKKEILLILQEKSVSQPELKRLTSMYKAHISRNLKELANKKLIVCRNPKDRVFKFYRITPLGKKVIKEVQRIVKET